MPSQLLRGSAAEATTHLTLAFNGTVPSNAIYSSYTAEFARVGEFALANSFAASYANETNAALTTRVLTNLGVTAATIGASSYATLASAVETAFAAYPAARGQVALNLVRLLTGLEGDATYGTAAVAWNNNAATAFTYSSNTANTASTTIAALNAPVARSLVLTTGLDNITGGAGNDTFSAVDTSSATTQTLTSGDSISGGAGTDTLNIAVSGGAAVTAPSFFTSGVEVLNVTNNNTGTYTIEAALLAGLQTVKTTAGASATTVQNQTTILNAELVSSNQNVTLAPAAAAVAGSADAMTVTLNGAGTSANTTVTQNGVETINVVLSGAASGSAAASTRVSVASNALDAVNVSGSVAGRLAVNFAGATNLDVATLNASAATAGVDVDVTLGASGLASITGGAGNDSVTVGTLSRFVTIAGGDGTDTLTVTSSGGTYSATATPSQPAANVSGFEILAIANTGSADVRQFTNNTGFTSFEAAGASATLGGVGTAATTLTARATGGTVTVTRATDSATADTITVNLAAPTPGIYTALSIADEETITLNSGGTASGTNTITTLTGTDATSLTVTGSNALTITTLSGGTALRTINAGAHTGNTFSIDASNSAVAMTVTGSAGVNSTTGALVNTITTGTGNDSITGGAFYDVLTGGVGNDTINGGGGNDSLYGNANNDVIDGGEGDDLVDGDVGNDSLTGGAGNDTIQAGVGSDTVSGGDGNDRIYMQSLNDDDSIDGGAGTDTLSVSAVSTIPAVAQYVDVTDSTTARIAGVETGYIQITTTGSNTTAATALTLDMTAVTGMSTLWLDVNDGTNNGDEFIVVKNFSGSTINLTGLASATDANPESLTLDGTGQASLTVNVRSYAVGATTEATVFTGVEAVTVNGQSVINSANVTNTLGAVTAASASSITARTSGSTVVTPNTGALTIDALTAANAQTVALSAGSYDSLVVTTDVVANNGLVQTLDIDVGTGSTLNIDGGDITLTGATVRTATIDLLADGNLFDNADGATVDIDATTITSLQANLGANSKAGFDLNANVTRGDVAMSSGSKWNVNTIGSTGASAVYVTGTGDVDSGTTEGTTDIAPGIRLTGTTVVFDASGLTDADSLSISSTASTSSTISAPLSTSGAEISSGAGADVLTGNAGNDRFGLTGRVETITIATTGDLDATDKVSFTFNGVDTADVAYGAGATVTSVATAIAAEINKHSATSFVTATSAAGVVTVTYAQYFGTAGAVKAETDADNDTTQTFAVTTAGDNAGADTISGGVGVDTIMGGSGADNITGGTGLDQYNYIAGHTAVTIGGSGNSGTISGFDVINGFALGTASTSAESITLLGATSAVVADSTGTDGTDSALTIGGVAVKSHAIASGIVTFDDADTFAAALTLTTEADLAAVVQYLQLRDLGNAGATVAFVVGSDTYVFMQGSDAGTDNSLDILIKLVGVAGTSVSTTNGSTAGLIDITTGG